MDVREATIAAMDTSGRAILFAGLTVIIALLGMFATGVSFLYGARDRVGAGGAAGRCSRR